MDGSGVIRIHDAPMTEWTIFFGGPWSSYFDSKNHKLEAIQIYSLAIDKSVEKYTIYTPLTLSQ